jgi:potassium efflux system protein
MFGRRRLQAAVAAAMLVAAAGVAGAQQPETATPNGTQPSATPSPADVLKQAVDALQQQFDGATDLADDARANIEKLLSQARSELKAVQESDARADQLSQQAKLVAADAKRLETQLTNEQEIPDLRPAPDKPLEAQLAQANQDLTALTAQRGELLDPQARTARRKALREQLLALPQQIADVAMRLQATPPAGELPLMTQAVQVQLQARKLALERQQAAIQWEIDLYDAEDPLELPRRRRELLDFKINRQKRFVTLLEQQVAELRRALAEDRIHQAEVALVELPPEDRAEIGPIIEKSLEYAREVVRIRQERQKFQARLDEVNRQLTDVQKQFEQASNREQKVGLTPALGLRLRQQRQDLEDFRAIRRRMDSRLEILENAQLRFLDHTDQLELLGDMETQVQAVLDQYPEDERSAHEGQVRRELDRQRANLTQLVEADTEYTVVLDELDLKEEQLIQETSRFANFIDEHILWIRSDRPLDWPSVVGDKLPLVWLLSGRLPRELGQSLWHDVRQHPLWWIAALLLWLALFLRGTRLRQHLRELARTAESRVQTNLRPTLHACWLTVLISVTWPGLCLLIAWRLVASEASTSESAAFGRQLAALGVAFLCLEFFRQVCRNSGLAEAHFGWNERTVLHLRRAMRVLILCGFPLALVSAAFNARERSSSGSDTGAVEILAFIPPLCVLVFCAHRLLKPSTGVLREATAYTPGGWLDRLRGLIWLAGVAVPVSLIVQTAIGYYYTAQQLLLKVEFTVFLILAVLSIRALLYRWLMLKHRRLRLDQLRQRRAAAEAASAGEAGAGGSEIPEVAADPEADLHAISRQTERLVNSTLLVATVVGIWFTWVDVLPALNYLDRWELWTTYSTVEETVANPAGGQDVQVKVVPVQITIVHLIWCLVLVMFTFTAARNVPGLLEIAVLQHLPLDTSIRYAISALTRYAIVLLGIVLSSQSLGIGWSQVQWLAAALTFGLGFGLQEIFANFISGIIILFEQPVRVGDLVTIGDVSGRVSRIRIRATTITDFDRKDFIVPNKEFITGRLLNWTLTDTTNRVVINIGVAYGSNTNEVRAILTRVVQEHPLVLEDPAPLIFFEKFGESSLDFLVMAFLPSFDNRVQTIHELNTTIHDELTKSGIEIPFPQRDLRVRSLPDGLKSPSGNGAEGRTDRTAGKPQKGRSDAVDARMEE